MSLYDDYLKDTKSGSFSDQYNTESGSSASTSTPHSYYDDYLTDMKDKPAVPEPQSSGPFQSVKDWLTKKTPGPFQYATDALANTKFMKDVGAGLASDPTKESLAETVLKPASFGFTNAENAPFGIGQVVKASREYLKDPNAGPITFKDVLTGLWSGGVNSALDQFVSGPLLTPASAAIKPFVDTVKGDSSFTGLHFDLTGIGLSDFSSSQYRAAKRIGNGENLTKVIAEEGVRSVFDTLFFLGIAYKLAGPRSSVIAGGEIPTEKLSIKEPMQSFKLYKEPTPITQPVTPDMMLKMAREKGIDLSATKYDPSLPTYFRVKASGSGDVAIGEVVQIKPSYLDTFLNKLHGDITQVPNAEVSTPLISQKADFKKAGDVQALPEGVEKVPLEKVRMSEYYPSMGKSGPLSESEYASIIKENPGLVEAVKNGTAPPIPVRLLPDGTYEPFGDGATRLIIYKHLGIDPEIVTVGPSGKPLVTNPQAIIPAETNKMIPQPPEKVIPLPVIKDLVPKTDIEKMTVPELVTQRDALVKEQTNITANIGTSIRVEPGAVPSQKPAEQSMTDLTAITKRIDDLNHAISRAAAESHMTNEALADESIRNLTLRPSMALPENQAAEVAKIFNGNEMKKALITKADIRSIIANNQEFKRNPELVVDPEKNLNFQGEKSSFYIKATALGLNPENLKEGDVIRVDPKTLTGKVQQLRVYNGDEALANPIPVRGSTGGRFVGSVSDRISYLSSDEISRLPSFDREDYKNYLEAKLKALPALKPGEVVTIYGGDGGAGQYVDTNIKVALNRGVNENTKVRIMKKADLKSTLNPEKTARGERIIKETTKENLASTKGGQKTITKILERTKDLKQTDVQEVPADFKISERAKQILEEFGVPIAERSLSSRYLGLYKPASKKIRVQALYDITTVVHEAVHAIDDQINFSKRLIESTGKGADVRGQLTEIYAKLYPGGNKNHKLNKRIQEGLAVLFENYFYNPAEIVATYPDLVKSFIKPDGEYYDPQFTKLLEKMNTLVEDYSALTPEQRIGSRIRTGKEVVEQDTGFTKQQRAIFETVNRFEPLKRYAEKAGVSETWADPTIQAFNVLNKNSIVAEWVKGGSTPILLANGDFKVEKGSVQEYLNLIKGDEKAFYSYLVARRVHEAVNNVNALKNELEAGEKAIADGEEVLGFAPDLIKQKIGELESIISNDDFSTQDAAAVVGKYASKFAGAEKIYDDINRRLIDMMEENDLIDADKADMYRSEKGYASFKRYIEDDLNSVGTLQTGSKSKISSLRERKGSQLDLQSPVQSQINAINEVMGKAFENRLWNKVAALTKGNPEIAQRFERIEARPAVDAEGGISFPQEKDPNVIRVFNNGKREFYKAAPEFLAVSKTLRGKEYDFFVQLMRVPASIFTRLTTSANPLFAVGNLTVDQFTAATQSKTGFKPIIDPIKSLIAHFKSDEAMKAYRAIGGKRQTLAAYFDLSPDEIVHKLTGGQTKTEKVVNAVDKVLGILEWASNTSEIMTRFSEFKRSVDMGESMSVAMYRAAEVTTPFQLQGNMGGRFGQEYIKSIPYLNATIQVIYKFARTVKSNPKRVGTMMAGLLAAAATSAIALMKGSSDEQKRLLGEQPARNFSRYLYAPSPDGKNLIKIRIPEQFGSLTGLVYMYVIGNYGGNEATFGDYLDNVMNALPEQVNVLGWANAKKAALSYIPQILKPTVQVATNTKVFPDVGPIVPPYVVDKAPKEQYNIYTSEVAKTIGSLIGASPILTDFWIKNQFGTVGALLVGKTPTDPIQVKEGEFAMAGRSYNRFYDNKKLVTQQYDEIRKNNPDKYTDNDKERIKIEKGSYDKMSDALSDMRKISQTKELPENVKKMAYDILLNIDTEADQEDIRFKIGDLKGLIADLKD